MFDDLDDLEDDISSLFDLFGIGYFPRTPDELAKKRKSIRGRIKTSPTFMANYNHEFWNSIKKRMLEDRQNYLDLCHTKEEEVFKSSRYGQHREYFYVDGVIIEMPEIYSHIRVYKKYLLG